MHLYIHVPFCARRCSYCDFSIAVRREIPVDEFVGAIAVEFAVRALGGQTLDTVYLGGGTPSKLGGEGVARVIDAVRNRFTIAADAEVTIEANPEDVDIDAVRRWREVGVNRLSLGAQSFDPGVLEWMHRTHSAGDTAQAVKTARDHGITDVSLDLIFALPEELRRDWSRDLDAALALRPTHLSAYGLTIERATPLGRWTARGEVHETPEELWAAEFTQAHDTLTAAGYAHYEVSNYARDGRRARHNAAYWKDRAYLGVGPSAHGFDGTTRRWNESAYAHWLARVQSGQDPLGGEERLTPEQRRAERIYLGLRADTGLDVGVLGPERPSIVKEWEAAGWVADSTGHDSRTLRLTAAGWMRLDAIASALTAIPSRY